MFKGEIGEKCGVVGAWVPESESARLAHPALFSLQHRGQESCGIASTNGKIQVHKGMGLITHVFSEEDISQLGGPLAIGHTRYSTSQGSTLEHAQPVVPSDRIVALAHNGNLPSTQLLEDFLRERGLPVHNSTDSEMMTDAIAFGLRRGATLEEAITDVYRLFTGAFSLVVMTRDKLAAVRDAKGIRPLSLGQLNGKTYLFASETCALDTVGAKNVFDVLPGEMVVLDENGLFRYQLTPGEQKLDIFELVYFARPDSILLGKSVHEIRKNFGRILAGEAPVSADLVLAVPDSAKPAALGYAEASGIPYDEGIIKNRYVHRTFIQPHEKLRGKGVELKLNPIEAVISGKRVVILDDSIVRGTTVGPIVAMLRRAGAREVHVRISSPPVRYPDYYGIDTPDQTKLIAARMSVEEICEHCGADSLAYLSYQGMIRATGLPEGVFSTSCFSGEYPIDIRERAGEIVRF
jgi:amidophosphoribosyltransferase